MLARVWHLAGEATPAAPPAGQREELWARLEALTAPEAAPTPLRRVPLTPAPAAPARRPALRLVRTLSLAASLVLLVGAAAYLFLPVTATAPADRMLAVSLPDGSTATLEAGAALSYRRFFLGGRSTNLAGAARFEVTHDPAHPFTVEAGEALVTVLGTVFRVDASAGQPVDVAVVSGRVRVAGEHASVELTAGQAARVAQARAARIELHETFRLEDATLGTLFATIGERFDVEIEVPEALAARPAALVYHAPYTASDLVESLCLANDVRFEATASGFTILP